jgi:hypothetical protein
VLMLGQAFALSDIVSAANWQPETIADAASHFGKVLFFGLCASLFVIPGVY